MNSYSFQVNEVKMRLSLLDYNLTNWVWTLSFPNNNGVCKLRPSVKTGKAFNTFINKKSTIEKPPYSTTYPQCYTHYIHNLKSTCYFKASSKAAISSLEKREYAIWIATFSCSGVSPFFAA